MNLDPAALRSALDSICAEAPTMTAALHRARAVQAILDGDPRIRPEWSEPDAVHDDESAEEAYAWGAVLNDGPWWVR